MSVLPVLDFSATSKRAAPPDHGAVWNRLAILIQSEPSQESCAELARLLSSVMCSPWQLTLRKDVLESNEVPVIQWFLKNLPLEYVQQAVEVLIDLDMDCAGSRGKVQRTLVDSGMIFTLRRSDITQALLKAGGFVPSHRTLELALRLADYKSVALLLAYGVSIPALASEGHSPLERVCEYVVRDRLGREDLDAPPKDNWLAKKLKERIPPEMALHFLNHARSNKDGPLEEWACQERNKYCDALACLDLYQSAGDSEKVWLHDQVMNAVLDSGQRQALINAVFLVDWPVQVSQLTEARLSQIEARLTALKVIKAVAATQDVPFLPEDCAENLLANCYVPLESSWMGTLAEAGQAYHARKERMLRRLLESAIELGEGSSATLRIELYEKLDWLRDEVLDPARNWPMRRTAQGSGEVLISTGFWLFRCFLQFYPCLPLAARQI